MFHKVTIITVAIFIGTVFFVVGVDAAQTGTELGTNGQCHSINTTLTSVAGFATFTTEGEVKSGFLKGTTKFTGDPLSLTPITSEPSPPIESLTFSYTGDLEITTEKGTLTTRGVGVFEGIPFGIGTQFDRVIGGTGLFDGATGFLTYTFEADETGAAFTSIVTGEICVDDDDDGDDDEDDD